MQMEVVYPSTSFANERWIRAVRFGLESRLDFIAGANYAKVMHMTMCET